MRHTKQCIQRYSTTFIGSATSLLGRQKSGNAAVVFYCKNRHDLIPWVAILLRSITSTIYSYANFQISSQPWKHHLTVDVWVSNCFVIQWRSKHTKLHFN